MLHMNEKSKKQNASAWQFDPDWLIDEDADDDYQSEVQNNASKKEFGKGKELVLNPNLNSLRFDSLLEYGLGMVDISEGYNEKDTSHLRNRISLLVAEVGKKDVLQRHLIAQNMSLRNELSNANRELSSTKREVQTLNDHVTFLRHVTAPTPDAGALDVSLALLRGHELERSKTKELMLMEKCDILRQQKRELELQLENEKHCRTSIEAAFQNELERLNQDISRLSVLKGAALRNYEELQMRLQTTCSDFEMQQKRLLERHEMEKRKLLAEERKKADADNESMSLKIKALEEALKKERDNGTILNNRLQESQIQIDLAWAEVDGYRSLKRGQIYGGGWENNHSFQNQNTLNLSAKRVVGAPLNLQLTDADTPIQVNKEKTYSDEKDIRKNFYISALEASRIGLIRIIQNSNAERNAQTHLECPGCQEKEQRLSKVRVHQELLLQQSWKGEYEKRWRLEKEAKLDALQRDFAEEFKKRISNLLK